MALARRRAAMNIMQRSRTGFIMAIARRRRRRRSSWYYSVSSSYIPIDLHNVRYPTGNRSTKFMKLHLSLSLSLFPSLPHTPHTLNPKP